VQGDFSGGGYSGQQSRDHYTRIEFQNMTTMSHGAHAIKFGTRMRDSRDATYTNGGFNGSFTFADTVNGASTIYAYQKYMAMANGLAASTPFSTLVGAAIQRWPFDRRLHHLRQWSHKLLLLRRQRLRHRAVCAG